jgi:hypothetical protein
MALVGWWPLDGNTDDYSVNNNTGVNNNVTFVNGKIGQAGSFNGTASSFVNLPANNNFKPQLPISISLWYKPNVLNVEQMLFQNDGYNCSGWASPSSGSNLYHGIVVIISSSNAILASYGNGGSCGSSSRRTAVSANGIINSTNLWYHITVIIKGPTNFEIYVNGMSLSLTYSGTGGNLTYSSSNGRINGAINGGLPSNSLINDVRLYDYVLSQKEINELAKAKVLHYTFNKDESITYDTSGLKRDISKVGTPVWNSTGRLGSGSYTFSSGNRLQRTGLAFPVSSDRLTLAAWVYPTGTHTNDRGIVIQENGNYYLTVTPTQQVSVYWYDTSVPGYHTTTETLPLNTWSHIATVWNGTQNLIYINGVLVKTTATNTPGRASFPNPVTVGGENNNSRYFVGSIDDTRIYATALTTADILDMYQTRSKIDNNGNLYANEFVEDYEVASGITLTQLFENSNEYVRFGTTATVNGITRTLQSDDSWILSGTATATSEAPLSNFFGTTGLYYFNGMGTNDSNVGTRIIVWFNNSITSFQIFSNGESVLKQFDQPTQNNLRIWYNVLNGNTVNNMRIRPLAVNTTTVFGAGNEPSKEQLDAWYRDYSQSRTKSNGQIITNEFSEVDSPSQEMKIFKDKIQIQGSLNEGGQ